jgi:hypothetical protein
MPILWRGLLTDRWRLWGLAAILGVLLAVTLFASPPSARASEGPTAELRDVVSALRDLNATLKEVAQNLEGIERALKENRR